MPFEMHNVLQKKMCVLNTHIIISNFSYKIIPMEHKKELEDLNKKSLEKIDEYLKTKYNLDQEHHEKINEAKKKWQNSWTDFMDVLMYLETLEI
jgi:hypothetical protein